MKYIIELVADSKGVQAGIDALEQIEKRDKDNAEQFKKTKGELLKYTSTLDGLRKGMIETGNAAAGAFGGEALVNYARWLVLAIVLVILYQPIRHYARLIYIKIKHTILQDMTLYIYENFCN